MMFRYEDVLYIRIYFYGMWFFYGFGLIRFDGVEIDGKMITRNSTLY